MNNEPNSGGRKKHVTEGNGNVGKQESVNTGGPVGRKDGYAGRKNGGQKVPKSDSRYQGGKRASGLGLLGSLLGAGQSTNNNNNNSGGSGLFGLGGSSGSNQTQSSGGRGGLGRILGIILILVLAFVLWKSCSGGSGCSLLSGLSGMSGIADGLSGLDISNGFNTYDAADQYVSAESPAISASTSSTAADLTVSNAARGKYTQIKGNGNDVVTLMVFMCGTDLESKYGMATNDMNEMLHATLNDEHLNIIVQTGGTNGWKNSVMKPGVTQRWRIRQGGIEKLNDNMGNLSMVDPATLSDFIRFCAQNYPANRNMLIFWDHGGGSLSGYGYDQYHKGSMTLDKINRALSDGGVKFDFIGFDACLMATMETAVVTQQYADYLIGSEETEPGCGWYYTNWLTALSKNPSISTVQLGKTIIDDFNDVCKKNNAGDSTTLSIVDLAEFSGTVPSAFGSFASSVSNMLDGSEYQTVASARRGAREFGASAGINHVDLVHLAGLMNTAEGNALVNALQGCIKYNRTSKSMANSYGMSIYFPFTSFSGVNSAISLYNAIGMDSRYSQAVKSFASMAAGGQIATGSTSSPIGSLLGSFTENSSSTSSGDLLGSLLGSYLGGGSSGSSSIGGDVATSLISSILGGRSIGGGEADTSWFDSQRVLDHLDYYDAHAIYSDDLYLTDKDGGKVLSMSPEKWDIINDVQLNVFIDDGEGYIDLGMDNVYSFDKDGDLKIEYDGTWLALDGQVVPYYMMSNVEDGADYVITGRVPAELNGELVYLIVVFDNETAENEFGRVVGARSIYENDETDTVARGLVELKKGDKIRFVCDYYTYGGDYQQSYYFGETMTFDGEFEVSNVSVGSAKCVVTYCLTDIYDNEFWTESLEY
ncbi:MAG: peptidase C11 [Clostridia bacterium]|nr:peptidase C11 [Clostridia bacterium]